MSPKRTKPTTAKASDVAWTPMWRKQVLPLRGVTKRTPDDELTAAGAWVDAIPEWITASAADKPTTLVKRNLAKATKPLATLMKTAMASATHGLSSLDVDTEAAMVILLLRDEPMTLWVRLQGVTFAVRVLVRMGQLRSDECDIMQPYEDTRYLIEDGRWSGNELYRHRLMWRELRRRLAVASDTDLARARSVAEAAFASANAVTKAALAFAFADETWASKATDAFLVEDEKHYDGLETSSGDEAWQMLIATATIRDVMRLAANHYPLAQDYALTLLARHGAAAIPAFARMLTTSADNQRFITVLRMLALVRVRAAIDAAVPVLAESGLDKELFAVFKSQPYGKTVLAREAKKSGARAKRAAKLLAKLDA